jgi:hypothetical protein
LFYFSATLMVKEANRRTFVALQDPLLQLGWLESIFSQK